MATISAAAQEPEAPINHFGRMFGALFSPKETFQDISQRPTWVAPIVLITLISIGFVYVMNQRVDWSSYIRQQAEKNARFQTLPEDQKEQTVATQAKYAPRFAYGFGVVGTLGFSLIMAGIYLGAFNVMGAAVNYKKSLAIVSHGLMPSAVGALLGIVTMLLKRPGEVDPQNLLASSPGALLSNDAPHWLTVLATSVELFWLWCLILFAVGFAATNPKKLTTGKAFGIVFALWAVWLIGKVGWAAIFS